MPSSRRPRTQEQHRDRKKDAPERPPLPVWVREALGLALLVCAVFLCICLLSYAPETDPGFFHRISTPRQDAGNLGGVVGAYAASLLRETLGLGSYFVCALLAWGGVLVLRGRKPRMAPWKIPLGLLTLIWVSTLFALLLPDRPTPHQGGIVGHQVAQWLLAYLHPTGSYLLIGLLLVLSTTALGEFAILEVLRRCLAGLGRALRASGKAAAGLFRFLLRRALELIRQTGRHLTALGRSAWQRLLLLRDRWQERKARIAEAEADTPRIVNHRAPATPTPPEAREASDTPKPGDTPPPRIVDPESGENPLATGGESPPPQAAKPAPVQTSLPFPKPIEETFRPPPLELLDDPDPKQTIVDEEALRDGAAILQSKLRDFGVEGRVSEIHPGPIITLYEYEPASGVKVNRIVNLADDLALAMKALSVRIVAPIPGKAVVGIEVPNPKRQTVYLKEILGDESFQSCRWKLPLALGKDIAGKPVTTDLSRMPHLLIAGATGTGKSVSLHSLILSILFRFSPSEVKFLMIDPKMLELTSYHGIPHLLHPVITDARRASDVLDWAVERMEQRYQLLSEEGVRNIESYNARIDKELASAAQEPEEPGLGMTGTDGPEEELDEGFLPEQGRLPYIILVIDEMADLMIVSGRQIEETITRLAQMARAAGIHLLLATQRPSVDVLTGIIKANLPARISFRVSSRTDSRTILDSIGAERLLGRGDMLFLPPGTSKVRRIHGPYVSEPEIERVVDFLKQRGRPAYEKIPFKSKKSKDDGEEFEHDEKYDHAVQIVAETRQASISMIQRRLRVGYNRAARMIERMEQEGVVGPQEGVKPREVLVNNLE